MSTVLPVIGFILAWLLLVVSTYKGHSAIYMSLACALILLLLSGVGVQEGIMGTYMPALAGLCTTVFPLVLMGSILGQLYVDSGAASAISFALSDSLMKNASPRVRKVFTIALIYFVGCLLCYGGVDSAALMFTLVPLALVFFEAADIPRKYAAAICVHVSCICLSGVGAPTYYNIYPGLQLGTAPSAGFAAGVTALVLNVAGGILLASLYVARDEKKGLGGFHWGNARRPEFDRDNMPHPLVALIPLAVAMLLFVGLGVHFVASIGAGVVLSLLLFYRNFSVEPGSTKGKRLIAMLSKGTASGINGAIVLCSMSAFGAVVQTNPVFSGVSGALMRLPLPPVFAYALLVGLLGILTAATVSGFQAGLGLALEHGKFGLTDAVLHRVGAASAATFNLAPFTGGVFVTLNLAGLSHKEGYGTIVKLAVLMMAVSTAAASVLCAIFPSLP